MIQSHVPSYAICISLKEAGFPQKSIHFYKTTAKGSFIKTQEDGYLASKEWFYEWGNRQANTPYICLSEHKDYGDVLMCSYCGELPHCDLEKGNASCDCAIWASEKKNISEEETKENFKVVKRTCDFGLIAAPLLTEILPLVQGFSPFFNGKIYNMGLDDGAGEYFFDTREGYPYPEHENAAEAAALLWLDLNEKGKHDV